MSEQGCEIDPGDIRKIVEPVTEDIVERIEAKASVDFTEEYWDTLHELVVHEVDALVREAVNHAENFANGEA